MTHRRHLFKQKGYSLLLAMHTISATIVWLDFTLIFSLLAHQWHATPATMGLTSALYGLPALVLGPLVGRMIDCHNPYAALYCSHIVRGTTSLALVLAPSLAIFILMVFLKGLGNLGAMPAEQVLVRTLLDNEQRISNTALMTMIDQSVKVGTPLLAALLAQGFRSDTSFIFSALLSAISLALLPILKASMDHLPFDPASRPQKGRRNALAALLQQDASFRHAFRAILILSVALGLYDPLLALLLHKQGFPAGTFGTIVSCTALGAIIGAMSFRRARSLLGDLQLIAFALAGFGTTVAFPGLLMLANRSLSLPLMLFMWGMNGAFYSLVAMSFAIILQARCTANLIGTISSSARSAQLLALVLGPLAGAALARFLSLELVFVLSGMLALGGALLPIRSKV